MSNCLFCKIVNKEIPAQIVLENDHVLAFKDIHPVTPTHALVIPKKHIVGMHEVAKEDVTTVGEVLLAARDVAEKLGLHTSGYRIDANNGPHAGLSVLHLHVHVLGGRQVAGPAGCRRGAAASEVVSGYDRGCLRIRPGVSPDTTGGVSGYDRGCLRIRLGSSSDTREVVSGYDRGRLRIRGRSSPDTREVVSGYEGSRLPMRPWVSPHTSGGVSG